jgi:prefoldin subunit 5
VAQVTDLISAAFAAKQDLVTLQDEKGKTIIVPVASIAYVELGADQNRRVGFLA